MPEGANNAEAKPNQITKEEFFKAIKPSITTSTISIIPRLIGTILFIITLLINFFHKL